LPGSFRQPGFTRQGRYGCAGLRLVSILFLADSFYRHQIQQQASLTNEQESQLNAIASDWRTKNDIVQKQIQSMAAAGGVLSTVSGSAQPK
jgi:phosphoheptose isomerase